jgi:hypothetical protein
MTRHKIIQKSLLSVILAVVVYLKITNDHPDWMFDIASDTVIVLILLGIGEIIIGVTLHWVVSVAQRKNQLLKLKLKKR